MTNRKNISGSALIIIIFSLIIISGCAIKIDISGGGVCIGFGCPKASRAKGEPLKEIRDEGITFVLINETKFNESIGPDVDNFMRRYRNNKGDPRLRQLVDKFFQPARRVFGKSFQFDPEVNVVVDEQKIIAESIQSEWREVAKGGEGFERFLFLVDGDVTDVVALRWKVEILANIEASQSNKVSYISIIKINVESKKLGESKFLSVRKFNSKSLEDFASSILNELIKVYINFFENEYGLHVNQKE